MELHNNQIIHRDIKPANIFLCQNDLLKIGDLGIAKALTHLNFARTQIGTPCYMAPEVSLVSQASPQCHFNIIKLNAPISIYLIPVVCIK